MLASEGMRAVRMPPTSSVVGDRAAWSVRGGNSRSPGRGRRRGTRGRAGLDRKCFRRNRGRIRGRSGLRAGDGRPPHRGGGYGAGCWRKRIELDDDQASLRHDIVKSKDIPIPHADATIACGPADQGFLVGAVNVDSPAIGVAVALFQAAQPEDPSQQAVVAARRSMFQVDPFPGVLPMVELAPQRDAVADLILDDESAQRRSKAVRLVP